MVDSRAMSVVRLLPGDPLLAPVLEVWTRAYGPPDRMLSERLADARSLLFARFEDGAPVGFVHFRDRKAAILDHPGGDDETARLLFEAPEFAVYTFEQFYFAGGRWTAAATMPPIFESAERHLRATTIRWALVGHLHSDRPFYRETAHMLEAAGFRLRPGDYVSYRLDLTPLDPLPGEIRPGPYRWRLFGEETETPVERFVETYERIFPGDPPAERLRADLERRTYGPLSGIGYDGDDGAPAGVVLTRRREGGVLLIDRLGVAPEHRGRGAVSGSFLDYARRCRLAGIEALEFQVRSTNESATGLVAERLGARVVKVERFYVKTGEGEPAE